MVRERSIHLGRTDTRPHPPCLIVACNLWGRPVSQVLETDDVRTLIGCLQRWRHQPATRAAGTESRTQGDGCMAELTGGGQERWRRGGSGRWCGRGMPRQRGGGHGEGLLMSRETALYWRSLHGWQSLLNTNPWELGSPGVGGQKKIWRTVRRQNE